ncbi:SDR family oxidoreductase [Spirillospora sp. CA-255316]
MTGAGSGLGAATALWFAEAGATVVAIARTEAALTEIAGHGRGTHPIVPRPGDVTDEEGITRLLDSVAKEFGHLDTLVNNAGMVALGTIETVTTDAWRACIDVNVHGAFLCRSRRSRSSAEMSPLRTCSSTSVFCLGQWCRRTGRNPCSALRRSCCHRTAADACS